MTDAEKKRWKRKMDKARARKRRQREKERLARLERIGAAPLAQDRRSKNESVFGGEFDLLARAEHIIQEASAKVTPLGPEYTYPWLPYADAVAALHGRKVDAHA